MRRRAAGPPEEHTETAGARLPRTCKTRQRRVSSLSWPRVLHVDTSREWRGGQTQLLLLVRRTPGAAVACAPDGPLRPALEAEGVPVHPIPTGFPGRRALKAAARAHGAELLAAHTSRAHGLALGLGLPLVVHRRLDFPPGPLSRPKYLAPDGYVAVSYGVREVLLAAGVPGARIAVVHDGVDPGPLDRAVPDPPGLRRALGWPEDAVVLLAVGALVDHKGHRWLIEALSHLDGRVHLAIAGDGPLRRRLEGQARPLGQRVRLLGARSDVPWLLRSAALLVHPSTEEGLGQAVVEGLIAGLPVVASAVGGLPEVVSSVGALVPPRDPVALACAIRHTLDRLPEARARVAAAGEGIRARHHPDRLAAETVRAYRAVLQGPWRRRQGDPWTPG